MSRCYACCQENCGRTRCSCSCHGAVVGTVVPASGPPEKIRIDLTDPMTKAIFESAVPAWKRGEDAVRTCSACGHPENNHPYRHIFVPAPLADGCDPKLGLAAPKCPCKKHRSYQAKRRPQGNCEACWRFYVGRNP